MKKMGIMLLAVFIVAGFVILVGAESNRKTVSLETFISSVAGRTYQDIVTKFGKPSCSGPYYFDTAHRSPTIFTYENFVKDERTGEILTVNIMFGPGFPAGTVKRREGKMVVGSSDLRYLAAQIICRYYIFEIKDAGDPVVQDYHVFRSVNRMGLVSSCESLKREGERALREKEERKKKETEIAKKIEMERTSFVNDVQKLIGRELTNLEGLINNGGLASTLKLRVDASNGIKVWIHEKGSIERDALAGKEFAANGKKYILVPTRKMSSRSHGNLPWREPSEKCPNCDVFECYLLEERNKDNTDYTIIKLYIKSMEKTVHISISGYSDRMVNIKYEDNSLIDLIASKLKEGSTNSVEIDNSKERKGKVIIETPPPQIKMEKTKQMPPNVQEKMASLGLNKKIVTVTWTSATIRSGADNTSSLVTSVNKGDKLTVIGEYGQWLNVRLEDGKEGWISSRVVKLVADTEAKEIDVTHTERSREKIISAPKVELVEGVTPASGKAEIERKSVNQEQLLQKIKKCQEEVPRPKVGSPGWGRYYGIVKRKQEVCQMELDSIYKWYIDRLRREVMNTYDPALLKVTYKEWEASKDLQVIYELTVYDRNYANGLNLLRIEIEKSCTKLFNERNEIGLKAAYWKLGFMKGPGHAAWVENMINDRIKEIKELAEAEERRKQELAIAEQKRQDEIAAKRAKEKEAEELERKTQEQEESQKRMEEARIRSEREQRERVNQRQATWESVAKQPSHIQSVMRNHEVKLGMTSAENFAKDYFPTKLGVGFYYNCVQGPPGFVGKLFQYQKCVRKEMDGGELTGTFHNAMYAGSGRIDKIEIYSIRGDEVFLNYVKSPFVDYLFALRPVVLKIPKKGMRGKWDASDERDQGKSKIICISEYVPNLKTTLDSFQNVIKVTKTISFKNPSFHPTTEINYYAKGLGMIRLEMGSGKDKMVVDLVKVENN